ncbi:unnamed protein product, partial [Scytosiphon promiscuus]
ASTYDVVPDGGQSSSSSGGLNSIGRTYTLQAALDEARAGDTVSLANGEYTGRLRSTVSGREGSPVRIVGGGGAVLKASSPSILVEHSWVTLEVSTREIKREGGGGYRER